MLVVVQNDPIVPPGLLVDEVNRRKIPFRLRELFSGHDCDELEKVSGIIVLGGTMSVQDTSEFPYLRQLKEQIKEVLRKEVPYLGICLGGQLLAEVLGGRVHLGRRGEKGCHQIYLTESGVDDPLFSGMPEHFISFQWHDDCFDLPPGALHLARSEACPYQAFRHGKAAYGIQFHPEVTREIVLAWSSEEDDEQIAIPETFAAVAHAYREASLTFFGNFLQMVQVKE
jgi:GMP synthase (glutamine-hydrolysing)